MSDGFRNPSLAVDAICLRAGGSEILLIKRGRTPWKGKFAFPGGFVDYGEDPEIAVLRELLEETGIEGSDPRLFEVKGRPERDPRKHESPFSILLMLMMSPFPRLVMMHQRQIG